MNRIITAAAAVLILSNLTAAFAESNNPAAGVPVVAGILAPTSGDQAQQTANSAPPGFFDRMPAARDAQSVQRSFAAQAERARIAAGTRSQHPG